MENIPGVGSVVAESIHLWFKDKDNKDMLKRLLQHVTVEELVKKEKSTLSGKTFVLTGSLQELSRDEAQEKVRSFGGAVSSSVSNKTDYVVVGKDPGTKYDKALELGVKTISEKEFVALIGA